MESWPHKKKIRVTLWGDFSVSGPNGEDLTPSAAKNRALIAALSTNSTFERSRVWLQNKLWSSGDVAQAQGNLRKAVHDLRTEFGPYREVLNSDRKIVGLVPEAIEISEPSESGREFLSGLEVGDREFDLWLTRKRMSAKPHVDGLGHPTYRAQHQVRRKRILAKVFRGASAEADWVATSVADDAVAVLREFVPAEVVVETVEAGAGLGGRRHDFDMTVEIQVAPIVKGEVSLRLSVCRSSTLERLWGQTLHFAHASLRLSSDPNLARAVTMLAEGIARSLHSDGSQRRQATGALLEPILAKVFSMKADDLQEADEHLNALSQEVEDATFLAWRAQIRIIQYIERHHLDREGLAEAAQEFATKAMELAPYNATALSVAANTAHFLAADSISAAQLAQRAVDLQPLNALARWSLSTASLYAGDVDRSIEHANYGRLMTRTSGRRFWWELQMAATYLATGDFERALRSFSTVHDLNPRFRPPLRYLIGLYAHQQRWDDAESAVRKLQKLENGFSVERLLTDRDYPASLLFRPTGLNLDHLREWS